MGRKTLSVMRQGLFLPLLLFLQANQCLLSPSHAYLMFLFHSLPSFVPNHRHNHRPRHSLQRLQLSHKDEDGTNSKSLTNDEIARYSRHLVLKDIGMQGQMALKGSSVLVIGAGGLGSPCLMYLAAAGVGHVGIVDADTVDESNLQRQIIHATSTIGMTKCQSAARFIKDLNPHVKVRLYEHEFTASTAMSILAEGFDDDKQYDIVIDGSDNFPTKYLINDACAIHSIPWVYSAILAFEGQLSVFNVDGGPDYRDLLPVPPPPGDVPSCAEGGVLGVLPGTMGCLQATEALKYLLGRRKGLVSGRVLVFDALQMKFSQIGLEKIPSRKSITSLIDYQGFCGGPKQTTPQHPKVEAVAPSETSRTMDEAETAGESSDHSKAISFQSISPHECMEKLSSGWSPFVLDVRLQTEHEIVALPFTDRVVPHRQVQVANIPEDGDVLVYCKAGVRGKKACQSLVDNGVAPDRLYNLEGGLMRWQSDVDSSMPRY